MTFHVRFARRQIKLYVFPEKVEVFKKRGFGTVAHHHQRGGNIIRFLTDKTYVKRVFKLIPAKHGPYSENNIVLFVRRSVPNERHYLVARAVHVPVLYLFHAPERICGRIAKAERRVKHGIVVAVVLGNRRLRKLAYAVNTAVGKTARLIGRAALSVLFKVLVAAENKVIGIRRSITRYDALRPYGACQITYPCAVLAEIQCRIPPHVHVKLFNFGHGVSCNNFSLCVHLVDAVFIRRIAVHARVYYKQHAQHRRSQPQHANRDDCRNSFNHDFFLPLLRLRKRTNPSFTAFVALGRTAKLRHKPTL